MPEHIPNVSRFEYGHVFRGMGLAVSLAGQPRQALSRSARGESVTILITASGMNAAGSMVLDLLTSSH